MERGERGREMESGTYKLMRNPYPVPILCKEGTWLGEGPILSKNVCPADRRWYSNLDPHDRLFSHQTLTKARKDCRYHTDKAPNDSLDLILSSVYVHDSDLFVPKEYVTMQPESLNKETWRVLRNEMKVYEKPPVPLGHEMKFALTDSNKKDRGRKRIHPSSLQLDRDGPHTDRTNPGYCRKIDGTFYGI